MARKIFIVFVLALGCMAAYAEKYIIVNKPLSTLYVKDDDKVLMEAKVCLGRGVGQKTVKGDHKTPEGVFEVNGIHASSEWKEDFRDGKGPRKGAYGPWFFRLDTPQSTHIGIHGTCFPESVGSRQSDGCVRLRNEDLLELKKHVRLGMKVIITPDPLENK